MSGDFHIRPATTADYEEVCVLSAQVFHLHSSAMPHIFRERMEPWPNRREFLAFIKGANSAILVAYEDEALAGFIVLRVSRSVQTPDFKSQHYVVIYNIAVDPSWQRRGYGRALINAVVAWAGKKGVQHLELNVYAFNEAAARLYQSAGFAPVYQRLQRVLPARDEAGLRAERTRRPSLWDRIARGWISRLAGLFGWGRKNS
ncbi:MAG: GNAT family N-acetyltransferase [Alphaproteobacteria bacterium]|nr:GNAT family N-acetyltransferase [Alphaproteobacteria bacterium]